MGNNRNIWIFGKSGSSITKDKQLLIDSHIQYMVNKTLSMFEYKGLPETIPQRELELIIQMCRFGIITKDSKTDKLFVFYGGLGGVPNEYYEPTQAIVNNPYLRFNEILKLDDYIKENANAVIIWNDKAHIGLYPMFRKYAELLSECEITMRYQLINKRFMNILTADDDNTKVSIEEMFKNVEDGTGFGIIVSKTLIGDASVGQVDTGNTKMGNDLKDVIESYQYLKGSWYNDLGLNANYNMKRESINESESDMNEDALLPLIDNMLESRKDAVEQINAMFGTNISVDLSSSWKKIREEIVIREEQQESEIKEENPQPEEETQSNKVNEDGQD